VGKLRRSATEDELEAKAILNQSRRAKMMCL
jgi:hypothetical protein